MQKAFYTEGSYYRRHSTQRAFNTNAFYSESIQHTRHSTQKAFNTEGSHCRRHSTQKAVNAEGSQCAACAPVIHVHTYTHTHTKTQRDSYINSRDLDDGTSRHDMVPHSTYPHLA